MGNIIAGFAEVLHGIWDFILFPIIFIVWFFFTKVLPFLIVYIGVPLFILGAVIALSMGFGTVLFIIIFCVGVYYYIKGAFVDTNPFAIQKQEENQGMTNANQAIFKS
tara:strand:+ start:236 stop:559 length:324 start_codon:yes stop_codon:yes gene_type:complete